MEKSLISHRTTKERADSKHIEEFVLRQAKHHDQPFSQARQPGRIEVKAEFWPADYV